MGRSVDDSIIGEVYGYLTVVSLSEKKSKGNKATYWDCRCELCGNISPIQRDNILSGTSSSCGCRRGSATKVAELCGYSLTTVSRIMNGKWRGKYKEATVKAVKAAAKQIGYQPYYKRY